MLEPAFSVAAATRLALAASEHDGVRASTTERYDTTRLTRPPILVGLQFVRVPLVASDPIGLILVRPRARPAQAVADGTHSKQSEPGAGPGTGMGARVTRRGRAGGAYRVVRRDCAWERRVCVRSLRSIAWMITSVGFVHLDDDVRAFLP